MNVKSTLCCVYHTSASANYSHKSFDLFSNAEASDPPSQLHGVTNKSHLSYREPEHKLHRLYVMARQPPVGEGLSIIEAFTIKLRHTTRGMTPLDEWPDQRRDLYLTTHNTHSWQTSMPPTGFEPTIPASERPQNNALDGAVTGIDTNNTRCPRRKGPNFGRVFLRSNYTDITQNT